MADKRPGARLRAEAAIAVEAVVRGGRSLDAALADAERRTDPDQRGLLRVLCYGTVRNHWRLSARLKKFVARPLKSRDLVVHSLLAVGVFQLSDTRVASHAAVSLTVEAASMLKRPKLKGLVNAVLRNVLRQPPGDADDEEAGLTEPERWNHPQWLIDTLRADWPQDWRDILAANDQRAPMWLRVNAKRSSALDYRERLGDTDPAAVAAPVPGVDQALRLAAARAVDDLPGFADGDVSVQDAAAQLAAPWLLANGGERILDACAAPGGKSAHILELAPAGATLTAIDSDPERVLRVSETLKRLGLQATVLAGDASNPEGWWNSQPFDRILLDAPCSASGVIRRHPDIKHLRRQSDIGALATVQAGLLEACWRMLAPGGRLLYVTCSVLEKENGAVVGGFMTRHADAQLNNVLPNNNIHDLMVRTPYGCQILPGTQGLDGFFFACLEKRA
jgi:16S rRNA (cytosine967-C5)-methyltransferase